MGPSCRLRGTSAAVGRGRRTRRNGREIRKFAREVAYVHLARYLPCTSGGARYAACEDFAFSLMLIVATRTSPSSASASLRGLRRSGGCVAPRRNDVERNKSPYSVASHGSVARCACAEGVRLGEREMHLRRSRQVPRRAKRGALRSKVARGCARTPKGPQGAERPPSH